MNLSIKEEKIYIDGKQYVSLAQAKEITGLCRSVLQWRALHGKMKCVQLPVAAGYWMFELESINKPINDTRREKDHS